MAIVELEVRIEIKDLDKLFERIARKYGYDLNMDDITEYLNNTLSLKSTDSNIYDVHGLDAFVLGFANDSSYEEVDEALENFVDAHADEISEDEDYY